MAWLKLNEIKSLIKSGVFYKGGQGVRFGEAFLKGGRGSFCDEAVNENLIQTPKVNLIIHLSFWTTFDICIQFS